VLLQQILFLFFFCRLPVFAEMYHRGEVDDGEKNAEDCSELEFSDVRYFSFLASDRHHRLTGSS
jgi:hypothetical protein